MTTTFDKIIGTFEALGFQRSYVVAKLNTAADAAEARVLFEQLKAELLVRWSAMLAGDASPERCRELRAQVERVRGLSLTKYNAQTVQSAPPEPPLSAPLRDIRATMDKLHDQLRNAGLAMSVSMGMGVGGLFDDNDAEGEGEDDDSKLSGTVPTPLDN